MLIASRRATAPIRLARYRIHGRRRSKRRSRLRPSPPRSLPARSEEHTSELQSQSKLVCRLLLEKKKQLRERVPFDVFNIEPRCAGFPPEQLHASMRRFGDRLMPGLG